MAKRPNPSRKTTPKNNPQEALAVLIKNTRTGRRHLSLPQISAWLDVAVKHLGSINVVADRIGLSAKMLRQFRYVNKLAQPVQKLFAQRQIDSVDIAVHLSMLDKHDQHIVAKLVVTGELDSADVRGIIDLRKKLQNDPIYELIDRVKSTRNVRHYVAEFVVRSKEVDKKTLRRRFANIIGEKNIIAVSLSGSIGRIAMNSAGRSNLQEAAKREGVAVGGIVATIANKPTK